MIEECSKLPGKMKLCIPYLTETSGQRSQSEDHPHFVLVIVATTATLVTGKQTHCLSYLIV